MSKGGDRFNGVAIGSVGVGLLFLYAGVKGVSIAATVKALITGKTPAGQAQTTGITASYNGGTTSTTGNQPGPAGASGSNKQVLQQVAASFGWTGAEWTALDNVEMREAGYSLTATNPSSGAYGMAQFINGASEYKTYGGDSTTAFGQSVAMCNYIKQRYGSPSAAWAHEQSAGWY